MVIRSFVFFILLIPSSFVIAQSQFAVTLNEHKEIIAIIEVQKGYTLFGLAQASGMEIDKIRKINPFMSLVIGVGDEILLPISAQKIQEESIDLYNPVQLSYAVKQGDNLYQLSKLFNVSTRHLRQSNQIRGNNLKINQILQIGYISWPYLINDKVIEDALFQPDVMVNNDQIATNNVTDSTQVFIDNGSSEILLSVIKKEKGIAYCEYVSKDYQELIVMHPTAKINSQISLHNPMLNRTVKAKVVGELPKEAYPEDVSVVISSSVATALGALDKRFLVEITYVE